MTAATSKMESFVIIVNDFVPLTINTERSILDVAGVLDPSLEWAFNQKQYGIVSIKLRSFVDLLRVCSLLIIGTNHSITFLLMQKTKTCPN